ncbi:hypothetical protein A1O1_07179 [Capronia coronata CBS 617.96]|uniref:BTB domain-containing protein n=1 Tax=Capronia coronata CBS 617.96 TaxID=1182541 RepID=W9Y2U7_9EURO|nr:uncharacterized protein A1O1_07179 [Capronia coronata CBS 617.96]EXJ83556.1 hypothetical protein A1O1_07179 [Capronia coronata CBS 617.96]
MSDKPVMTHKQGLTAEHARSPMIKIILGSEEQYGGTDTATEQNQSQNQSPTPTRNEDLPVNVFYVNRSLLIEKSTYFAILLDNTSPQRTVVYLPQTHSDTEIFTLWLNSVFRGSLADNAADSVISLDKPGRLAKCFDFADFVGSYRFKNQIMDAIQMQGTGFLDLRYLRHMKTWGPSTALLKECVLECLAYKIASRGWAEVEEIADGGGDGGDGGDTNLEWVNGHNDVLMHRLTARVEVLESFEMTIDEQGVKGGLVDPSQTRDCRWHEHTAKDKVMCDRYRAEEHVSGTVVQGGSYGDSPW